MHAVYTSKLDTSIAVVLGVAAFVVILACWQVTPAAVPGNWLIFAPLVLLGVVLPAWVVAATNYTITDSELLIRSGPFRWAVPIREITSVTPTRSPLSSPALSLDRLRIDFGKGRSVMISPLNREAFVRDLESRRKAAL